MWPASRSTESSPHCILRKPLPRIPAPGFSPPPLSPSLRPGLDRLPTAASLAFAQVSIASLLLSIMGTRLALHGPPGAMHHSVDSLTSYRKHTTYALIAGLFAFFVSAGIHPWIYASTRVALPASIVVTVCAAGMALSMRNVGATFRLPKRRKVVGYYRSEDFEPGSLRGSMDPRGEPGTPGRVIQHVQSQITPANHQSTARRRVAPGRPGAAPPPARGADADALARAPVGLHAGAGSLSGSWFAPTLFGNVPPPLGHGRSGRDDEGAASGGCATSGPAAATGTELAPAASWFSRPARGAARPNPVAAGRPAAPHTLPPPAVRASSSYEVMMRAEALERQGRFREAAELLAEKMEQLHRAEHAAAGVHPAASEVGSDRRHEATRSWVGPSGWYGRATPEVDAAGSVTGNGRAAAVSAAGGTDHASCIGSSGNGVPSSQEPCSRAARGGDLSGGLLWRGASRHSAPAALVAAHDQGRSWFGRMAHRWNLY